MCEGKTTFDSYVFLAFIVILHGLIKEYQMLGIRITVLDAPGVVFTGPPFLSRYSKTQILVSCLATKLKNQSKKRLPSIPPSNFSNILTTAFNKQH